MLTKRTAKNQITLPKALLDQIPPCDYFDAVVEGKALVLRPVRIVPAEESGASRPQPRRLMKDMIGSGTGLFKTAADVDAYLENERETWGA